MSNIKCEELHSENEQLKATVARLSVVLTRMTIEARSEWAIDKIAREENVVGLLNGTANSQKWLDAQRQAARAEAFREVETLLNCGASRAALYDALSYRIGKAAVRPSEPGGGR